MMRLVVLDVDGCLTPGEAAGWNWDALHAIRAFNQNSGKLAVTLCTGRQEPYVEVMMQAIDAQLPGIYENGCGLYLPSGYRFEVNPLITPVVQQALAAAKTVLNAKVAGRRIGYFQPGKDISITLYPLQVSVNRLYQAVIESLQSLKLQKKLVVNMSVTSVDVTPAGIDKGTGVRWLSERTGIPITDMGGIGDSPADLPFLKLVGRSAAPANAAGTVKKVVDYVSTRQNGDGVVDILNRWAAQS